MKNTRLFFKRNLIEMFRDPLLYIMCITFPFLMFVLFSIINKSTNGSNPVFDSLSLTAGIMVFAYSFLALTTSLLISKDKSTAFLKRLYTSPMKIKDFYLGYFMPFLIVGLVQDIVCILSGFIFSLILKTSFIGIANLLLMCLALLPIMITNISIGIILGSLLNEKSAPGISSILISFSGIVGGCWMPIETMGGFYTFSKFLPFYPSVSLAKYIIGAKYLNVKEGVQEIIKYSFNNVGVLGIILIISYMIISIILALISFSKMMNKD